MTDYIAIMLNGLFTGIGVIFAHELWDTVKKYKDKIKNGTIKNQKTTSKGTKEM